MTCLSPRALSRAFSRGADAQLQAHLRDCQSCAATWSELGELRRLAQQLPAEVPDAARREAVRQKLLDAATELHRQPASARPRRLPRWAAWATAAAAAALGLFAGPRLLGRPGQGPAAARWRAAVSSQGAASFVHERSADDEWVRISDGSLHIEVEPLRPGERFRVVCGDGEVEVRGTAFETVVERDHLQKVQVLHGRVEVRPRGGPSRLLAAGDRWLAPAAGAPPLNLTLASSHSQPTTATATALAAAGSATAAAGPASAEKGLAAATAPAAPTVTVPAVAGSARSGPPATASLASRGSVPVHHKSDAGRGEASPALLPPLRADPSRPPLAAAPPPAAAPSPAELAFTDGWSALRQGRYADAAASFGRSESLRGSSALLEDARFWRGVALARATQRPQAIEALRDFLTRHPSSLRAGEAAAILGWQLLKAGQLDEAQRRFEAAAADSRPQISDNGRSGLAAVAAQRHSTGSLPVH